MGEAVGDYIIVSKSSGFNYDISQLASRKMVITDYGRRKIALARYPVKDFSGKTIGTLFL